MPGEDDQHQRVAHHLALRISSRYTSFAPRTGRVERRGSENRTPLYWLATTVHHGSQVIYTLTDHSSFKGTISRKVEIDKLDRSRHEGLCHS